MQIKTDGKDLIITPTEKNDPNDLYLNSVGNRNYRLCIDGKEIKEMRIDKEYLLKTLLPESV